MKRINGVPIISATDYHPQVSQGVAVRKNRRESDYLEDFFTFDIETTAIKEIEQSFMYVWQMYYKGCVIIGRTWKEFKDVIKEMSSQVPYDKKLVGYVHNLSYEFMYLSGIYDFKNEDVFAVDKRKILKCTMLDNIELRCSYLLSNMSLDEYCKKMGVHNKKLTGKYDYGKIRLSTTRLGRKTLRYCVNDVVGLHQAITTEMSIENDNISTIPLTSTGYIRRDCRKVMYKYKRSLVDKIYPTYPIYKMLRQAFRGGNTHANRYYAGAILKNVKSMDISSSYPAWIMTCKFPMTRFRNIGSVDKKDMEGYIKAGKACLMVIIMEGVELKDELNGCPYLSFDKCRGTLDYGLDNGRILYSSMLETTITDIDWKIIDSQYKYTNIYIKELAIAEYGELPDEFKDVILKYYIDKTQLKNVKGQELYYGKSKNKLNAGYGMMAQCPVKEPILYDGGEWNLGIDNEMDLLNDYKKTAFLVYQWGVWVTAWARYRLQEGIDIAGHDFVYCDTDSVKYIYIDVTELTSYNTARIMDAECYNAYADRKEDDGTTKRYYMGIYEDDGRYSKFITYGAKKYAYTDKDGLHITIAGVNKKKGALELEKHGGFKALKPGFKFKYGGGNDVKYNDDTYGWYEIAGDKVYITRNAYIHESEHTMSLGKDYAELLLKCRNVVDHLVYNY